MGDHSFALVGCRIRTGRNGQYSDKTDNTIVIRDGKIAAVGDRELADGLEQFDVKGRFVTPGFIDLQLNGCGGVLFNDDISENTLDIMHATNLRFGCTAFLPTLITSSDDDIKKAIEVVKAYRAKHPDRVPGLHIEGPWINPVRKGIHNPELVREPCKTMVKYICDHAEHISMLTLAPEVCPAGTIEQLTEAGIVVSIGHTNATCEQAKEAEQAGARFATHLHNAMTPLTSREPGVVGAVFDSDLLGAGIIADGHHLTWENLRIARKVMQDRLVLVTDATPAVGTDIEQFEFGGHTVYHQDGLCKNADGTLGGSALTMNQAVANSIEHGIGFNATIRMVTRNPAKAIGVSASMGDIAVGQFANLTILDDTPNICGVVSGGKLSQNSFISDKTD